MPDAARRSARGSALGVARRRPTTAPPEPGSEHLPCVIGALLRGQPELKLLAQAAAGVARLELVDDRFAIVSAVQGSQPGVVVLPPFDADRTSTFPLVLRVRREAPDVTVLVVASHPAGGGQPMLRAAQAGAHAVTAPSVAELRDLLAGLLGPQPADR